MTKHEHNINRADSARTSTDDANDEDDEGDDAEPKSEAETKRELQKSAVGRAILGHARRRRRR